MLPDVPSSYQHAPKPTKLSDPGCDFTPEMLVALVNKSVAELCWSDYQNLFGPFLPAGTYNELRYYVGPFVRFLFEHPEDRLDLITSWTYFSSENWGEIVADKAGDYVRDVHKALLHTMTTTFIIKHYDKDACLQKGWRCEYFDHVEGSEVVNQFLCDLWRFETHRDIALDFLHDIADFAQDATKRAWFTELSRSRYDVYKPPSAPEVTAILANEETITKALDMHIASDCEGTYWDDAFSILGR